MLGLARRADHHVASTACVTDSTAHATEPMARPPVHQPARMRENRRFRTRHPPTDRTQINEFAKLVGQQGYRVLRGADVHREHGASYMKTETRPWPTLHSQGMCCLTRDEHRFR